MYAVDTFDLGHWGPGGGWMIYAILLIWEGMGLTYVLRRRYVEPIFGMVAGFLVAIAHVFVIQKCYALTTNPDKEWNQDRCFSVNGTHFGLGLYTFLIGLYEAVLQSRRWVQREVNELRDQHLLSLSHNNNNNFNINNNNDHYNNGKNKRNDESFLGMSQVSFFIPSVFLMNGFIMMSHEQDTMWQTMIHQFSGYLSLAFFVLRAFSYQFRSLTLACGVIGLLGAFVFCNSSEGAFHYWMQMKGKTNFLSIDVSVPFLTLIMASYALLFISLTCVFLLVWPYLPPALHRFAHRVSAWCDAWPIWNHLDRLDFTKILPQDDEQSPHAQQSYGVFDEERNTLSESRLEMDDGEYDEN